MLSRKGSGRGDLWLGIAFLGTGILVLALSGTIHSIGLGNNFDPGPKAFPIGLSVLLLIGGFIELLKSRKTVTDKISPKTPVNPTVLSLLGGLVAYVVLLPLLGFALSTLVITLPLMIVLGNSWIRSAIVSAVLIIVVYLLFVVLFKVPLPGGVFGLPF
ncbi:MAG: tripartite tricarboxylate transporter TctB family protein [Verrucomicrobiae bacterium]|nr:tripartite tricarboxylate transporter TctB family protein [Verrucomicrobiae bacterium]